MRLDPLISRRFEELTVKAEEVSKTRQPTGPGNECSISSPLFREWATSALNLVERSMSRQSVHFENLSLHCRKFTGWEQSFEECRSIFKAAREDYEGGYLFTVRALVKAEVLSDAFQQARELHKSGYKDPAAILCRVALEVTLKELCDKNGITPTSLNRMNEDLCKAGVYNKAKQMQITAWAAIGNYAAHGKSKEYTDNDAQSMLDGVQAFVADIL
jgi:hypothetical protein